MALQAITKHEGQMLHWLEAERLFDFIYGPIALNDN